MNHLAHLPQNHPWTFSLSLLVFSLLLGHILSVFNPETRSLVTGVSGKWRRRSVEVAKNHKQLLESLQDDSYKLLLFVSANGLTSFKLGVYGTAIGTFLGIIAHAPPRLIWPLGLAFGIGLMHGVLQFTLRILNDLSHFSDAIAKLDRKIANEIK
jgi:hypothetical protein